MKVILTSMLTGFLGASVVFIFFQPSFASSAVLPIGNGMAQGACQVTIGTPRLSPGPRCFRDEVMVGRWNDSNYCATIQVVCE